MSSDVQINRLRMHVPQGESEAVGSRVAALVRAANIAPAAMPSRAILIVRRFGRGLPALDARPDRVLPPHDWQRAVSDGLNSMASHAARPALGTVDPWAEAVWFDDRAEMLACLAADWLAGVAGRRWWWQALLRNFDPVAPRVWLERAEYIPAAMERLAAQGAAVPFIRALSESVARAMVDAVVRVFALPAIAKVLDICWQVESECVITPLLSTDERRGGLPASEPVEAPWSTWVPEAEQFRLDVPSRRLLAALCLMLRRAPDVARTREFTSRLRAWANVAAGNVSRSAKPDVPEQKPFASTSVPEPMQEARSGVEEVVSKERRGETGERSPAPPPNPKGRAPDSTEPVTLVPEKSSEKPHELTATGAKNVIDHATRETLPPEMGSTPHSAESAGEPSPIQWVNDVQPLSRPLAGTEIETAFGGLFFLINLGIALGFYGDFSTPEEPGIELPLWHFIAQAGRELATADEVLLELLYRDPVWQLLSALAGAKPTGDPDGAVLLAVAALRERAPEVVPVLIRENARVLISDTHVDIFYSLPHHPIEIRLAGLDRDPGWVPAAGRYIAFHFD